jgi:hypothetical protein
MIGFYRQCVLRYTFPCGKVADVWRLTRYLTSIKLAGCLRQVVEDYGDAIRKGASSVDGLEAAFYGLFKPNALGSAIFKIHLILNVFQSWSQNIH